jgi:alpha-galactosidase
MSDVAELPVTERALVYEEGWQSWSPTTTYRLGEPPWRPTHERNVALCYRADRVGPTDAYQGEGLLAVDPGDGAAVQVLAATDPTVEVPSIRAERRGDRLLVSADGPVGVDADTGPGGLTGALGRWADRYAAAAGVAAPRPAPTLWCSWYEYYTGVSEQDMLENLDAMAELDLPVDVVQLDDGYQTEIGDWLLLSGRFRSLEDLVARIRDVGRRAGIWVAPFLVGESSRLRAEHPEWLVEGAYAGHNWKQDLGVLDVTHPDAAAYLTTVFTEFRRLGLDLFKIDFIYAGALAGRRHEAVPALEAYRRGVRLIRDAIGPEAYLLGCGAPILPSVGLFDAMRVGPDIGPVYEPDDGDMSQPSQAAATITTVGRAWQHGRFWVNDPDCLVARPAMERREDWAATVERYGGLRGSSDRLRSLDDWGLEVTRRLLSTVPAPTPFPIPEQGMHDSGAQRGPGG